MTRRAIFVLLGALSACGGSSSSNTDLSGVNASDSSVPFDDDSLVLNLDSSIINTNPSDAGLQGDGCASASASTGLQPVVLTVMLDRSGSMGARDVDAHDPAKRWNPVTAAMKAFFESPTSKGVAATLNYFPAPADVCEQSSYAKLFVELTELPSTAFRTSIESVDKFLNNTPTLFAMLATIEHAKAAMAARKDAKHAMVLVTDGEPTGCGSRYNSLDPIKEAVAAVKDQIPTYVIGVGNISNLHEIAAAGGTESALIVPVDDPSAIPPIVVDATVTQATFLNAINKIRSKSTSCDVNIPPPPSGQTLDVNKAEVKLGTTLLTYSSTCENGTGWRFDSAQSPTKIQLCPQTCEQAKTASNSQIGVEFGCNAVRNIR